MPSCNSCGKKKFCVLSSFATLHILMEQLALPHNKNTMPRKKDTITMKQKAMEFYNNYKWDKISFNSFYQLCRKDSTAEWEAVIKPKVKVYKRKYTWRFAQEMEWYDNQPEPKASKAHFRNRLLLSFTKEEAIQMWDARLNIRKERAKTRKYYDYSKSYTPTYSWRKEKEFDADLYRIDITYPPEVAKVFREIYEELISETEQTIRDTTERELQLELETKLELLKAELGVFISYNK